MDYKQLVGQYYQLSKPGIIYANALTAVAGYLFASRWHIAWLVFGGLLAGLSLVIAGACAANNYLDRGIDQVMQRTRRRALVTGALSGRAAVIYAATTTTIGLALLAVSQNRLTFILATVAWLDYVVLYGYSKRHSVHGTLVGCISGALPLVAGYTAVTGSLDLTAALLFLLMTVWQMGHFYGIALYRLKDYKAAHIPVMPAVYGTATTKLQAVGYIVSFILLTALLVALHKLHWLAGGVLLLAGVVWLIRALRSYRLLASEVWGKQTFLFSLIVILILSLSLAIDPLLAA